MKLFPLIACVVVVTSFSEAALPPLSPEEKTDFAELVLTGEVLSSRVLVHRKPGASVYLVRLGCTIDTIEKGLDLIGSKKAIEIRCWRMRKTKMVGPAGHLDIPADGSQFRMWLEQNPDGFWEPLEPNGIELLNDSPSMVFAEVERRYSLKQYLIWGGAGLLLLLVVAVIRFGGFPARSSRSRYGDLPSAREEEATEEPRTD